MNTTPTALQNVPSAAEIEALRAEVARLDALDNAAISAISTAKSEEELAQLEAAADVAHDLWFAARIALMSAEVQAAWAQMDAEAEAAEALAAEPEGDTWHALPLQPQHSSLAVEGALEVTQPAPDAYTVPAKIVKGHTGAPKPAARFTPGDCMGWDFGQKLRVLSVEDSAPDGLPGLKFHLQNLEDGRREVKRYSPETLLAVWHPSPEPSPEPAPVEVVTECPACRASYSDDLALCPQCEEVHPERAAEFAALELEDVFEDAESIALEECEELSAEDIAQIEALQARELEKARVEANRDRHAVLTRAIEAAGGVTSLHYAGGISDADAAFMGYRGAFNEPANVSRREKSAKARVAAAVKSERMRKAPKRGEVAPVAPSPEPKPEPQKTAPKAAEKPQSGADWARAYVAQLAAQHPNRAKKLAGSLAFQLQQLETAADLAAWQARALRAFDAKLA